MRKRMLSLLLAVVCCAAMLTACGGNETPSEVNYQLAVTDALGTPVTEGVVVKFLKDGQQAAMQTVNENGVAEKTMAAGDYTVELVFTDVNAAYYCDTENLVLTAQAPAATVQLLQKPTGEATSLYVSGEEHPAYNVNVGCTHVELVPGRNYFLFTPTRSGDYGFYTADKTHTVGLYGSPFFVQGISTVEAVEGVVKTTVKDSMIGTGNTGTNIYVVGVDAEAAGTCTLVVERLGEPTQDVTDLPWQVYQTTATLAPYTLPAGAQLQTFDLTADGYELVYNEADGYYHVGSADGNVVLMYLTEPTAYLDDLETVCNKSRICRYFYKEDGSFDRKESYNECLLEYISNADETAGVYPLTDDLIYIIQNRGEYYGWFDPEAGGACLFADENGNVDRTINYDIAWMFPLCYIA